MACSSQTPDGNRFSVGPTPDLPCLSGKTSCSDLHSYVSRHENVAPSSQLSETPLGRESKRVVTGRQEV